MTEEKRRALRLRTLKGGLITFGVAPSLDCIIRNMAETGAALEVQNQTDIPDDFTLLIKPELIKRKCQVVWRDGKRMGVKFVQATSIGSRPRKPPTLTDE